METQSLNGRQSKAIACLLEADTVAEAAENSGVARSTVYAWMKSPKFRSELEAARRAEHQARLNYLREAFSGAVATLEALMLSNDELVRLKAATEVVKAYLTLATKEAPPPLALDLPDEEWSEDVVPALAQRCMEGLLNGTLDARGVQMAPQYLAMVERAVKGKKGKAARKGEEEKQAEEMEEMEETEKVLSEEIMCPPEVDSPTRAWEEIGYEPVRRSLRGYIEATRRRWAG